MSRIAMIFLTGLALAAGGCQMPDLVPTFVAAPSVSVSGVEVTEVAENGTAMRLHLTLTNPNDVPLPLRTARYRIETDGAAYAGSTPANATVPKNGNQTLALPAAVAAPPGQNYRVTGSVEYVPPGEVRTVLTDLSIPLPTAGFSGRGELTGPTGD